MKRLALAARTPSLKLFPIALGLALGGCVTSPKNGDLVPSRSTPISFSALVYEHRGTITYEAANAFTSGGVPTQWETLATSDVATDGQFFTTDTDGISWWALSRSLSLQNRNWWTPQIAVGNNRHRALVRIRWQFATGSTPIEVPTFEAGPDTDACIDRVIRAGGSGGDIMNECTRSNVPQQVAVWSTGD